MEKAIVQACDTVSTWSNGYTQTNDAQFPPTTSSTQKICFSMKINGESTAYFPNLQRSVHVSQDIVNSGDLRIET